MVKTADPRGTEAEVEALADSFRRHREDYQRRVTGDPRTEWEMTGRSELRPGFLFGVTLWIEERRRVFVTFYTGHTPANWQTQTRWRRARAWDLQQLA